MVLFLLSPSSPLPFLFCYHYRLYWHYLFSVIVMSLLLALLSSSSSVSFLFLLSQPSSLSFLFLLSPPSSLHYHYLIVILLINNINIIITTTINIIIITFFSLLPPSSLFLSIIVIIIIFIISSSVIREGFCISHDNGFGEGDFGLEVVFCLSFCLVDDYLVYFLYSSRKEKNVHVTRKLKRERVRESVSK